MPDAHMSQQMVSDPLEVELQTVVSCRVGAGNRVQAVLAPEECSAVSLQKQNLPRARSS